MSNASFCWICGGKLHQYKNHTQTYTMMVGVQEVNVHKTCRDNQFTELDRRLSKRIVEEALK